MKTVKTFRYNEIFVYDRRGERLAGRVQDLLKEDHVIHTFYTSSTGSTRGDGVTAIFFDEDILNLPDQVWYFDGSWGPDLPKDFILVPIEYNGQQYDAWITVQKLNNCFTTSALQGQLKEVLPKYFSDEPERKLGFFDENLNEDINRDFTSDEQIANIMNNPDITLEEKCIRLFDRTPEHIYTYGMGSYYTLGELYDTARQNGVYEEFSDNITRLRYQCSNWKHEHTNRIGCTTVMCISNNTEPLTVQGSYDYYVNHRNTTRFYGEGTSYPPLQWWAYLKYCIEVFEEAVGYKPVKEKKLGFFDEDMNMKLDLLQENIDKNLTQEEIWDIMTNESLSGEQKSQKLFGRPEDYISHLQYFCMEAKDENTDYLREHKYLTNEALQLDHLTERLGRIGQQARRSAGSEVRGNITVCTVFYTSHDEFTLDGSWAEYVGSARQGYCWWNYIKFCINLFEESGLVQHVPPRQLGFFTESLDHNWLRNNFGITFEKLQGLIERNWEDDWCDENTGRYIDQFCLTWRRGQYPNADDTGIVSPCYDNCGSDYFDSLEKMCGYYSEEFIKEWITKYLEWCEQHGFWTRPQKRLGFFDD